MEKKKILILIDWYLPGYKAGGPIQSCANIIAHLKDDFDFSVITSDCDLHDTVPYATVVAGEWTKAPDGTRAFYFPKNLRKASVLKKLLAEEQFDILYLNSFFSPFFTLLPLYLRKKFFMHRKVVLAPRGMLGQGALNIKPRKKKLFITASKIFGLYNNIVWHASTESEKEEIEKVFGKNRKIKVALNLGAIKKYQPVNRHKEKGKLKLVFLSRISPKKNLEAVFYWLKKLDSNLRVEFDIYGPVDDAAYWDQCNALISFLPKNIRASYCGALENSKIHETLGKYHLSILPTHHENYGHSIVESMLAGCPVLISVHTPWKNLLQQKAGFDLPLGNENLFIDALEKFAWMAQEEFNTWSAAAQKYGEQIVHTPAAVEQNKELFLSPDHTEARGKS